MAIPSQRLTSELGVILKEEFGVILSPEELDEAATDLVGFFDKLAELAAEQSQGNYDDKEVSVRGQVDA